MNTKVIVRSPFIDPAPFFVDSPFCEGSRQRMVRILFLDIHVRDTPPLTLARELTFKTPYDQKSKRITMNQKRGGGNRYEDYNFRLWVICGGALNRGKLGSM